jgi:hypothetical protein
MRTLRKRAMQINPTSGVLAKDVAQRRLVGGVDAAAVAGVSH